MNPAINLLKLAWIQRIRHRVRSLLTILGVASGMFLFTAVESLQRSLAKATEASAADTTLVVYRQNRFCPSASRLPEHYADEIRRIDGVREVVPVQIVVNNCRAALHVVPFRGLPDAPLRKSRPRIRIPGRAQGAWRAPQPTATRLAPRAGAPWRGPAVQPTLRSGGGLQSQGQPPLVRGKLERHGVVLAPRGPGVAFARFRRPGEHHAQIVERRGVLRRVRSFVV